jgi:hypothetical protein
MAGGSNYVACTNGIIHHLIKKIMEKLTNKIKVTGVGIPGLTATLQKRTGNVAMYLRDDGYYEVGIIIISPENTFPDGTHYPEREVYFSNEQFGKTAFTTKSRAHAEKIFDRLLKYRNLPPGVK